MARMLRRKASGEFAMCACCDGKRKAGGRRSKRRERSLARAREKVEFKRDYPV